jgi:hypothetical protein
VLTFQLVDFNGVVNCADALLQEIHRII